MDFLVIFTDTYISHMDHTGMIMSKYQSYSEIVGWSF